jgi:hypothetical protein
MRKWWIVLVVLVVTSLPLVVRAQPAAAPSPSQSAPQAGAQTEDKMDPGTIGKCKEMQARHEQVMAEMKAMDARLDEKLAAMNAAKGDQKVEAMAVVINELVSQRKAMKEQFGAMHRGMRGSMRGQHGAMLTDCPMMKGHGGIAADTPKNEGTQ